MGRKGCMCLCAIIKNTVSHYLNFLHGIAQCLKSSKHDGPSLAILVPSTRGTCDLVLKKG